jgi:aminoglycoside phosphotransferase (APT) family kinase protein
MMTDETLDTAALGRWIGNRLDQADLSIEVDGRPSGGFSAETLLLTATSASSDSQRFVVRLETPEPAVYPSQSELSMPEIEIQYRIMDSIGRNSSLPVAGLVGYESDSAVLGTPFFVMHHVDGVVPIESPPYSVEGFFTDLTPVERTELISNGLLEMARFHALDTSALGLEWLSPKGTTPGSQHLLRLWNDLLFMRELN